MFWIDDTMTAWILTGAAVRGLYFICYMYSILIHDLQRGIKTIHYSEHESFNMSPLKLTKLL